MKTMYCRVEFRTGNEPENPGVYGAMFWFQNQFLEPNSRYIFFMNIEAKIITDEILLGYVLKQFTGEGCVYDINVYQMQEAV